MTASRSGRRCAVAERSLEARIERVIRDFPFDDYGMDEVEDIKDEEWLPALAGQIAAEVRSDSASCRCSRGRSD